MDNPRFSVMPLLGLLAADAISMSGNAMAAVAIPWFVLETTGSVTETALSGVAGALPVIIAAVIGGVWVDRLGHKRASIYADMASGVTVALIPILFVMGWLSFPLLLVLIFLGALLDAPGAAARGALVPEVARVSRLRLETVNSIHEVIESGSGFIGPLLAGLLIAAISASNVLLVDAISFGLSALLVAMLIPQFAAESDPRERESMQATATAERVQSAELHPAHEAAVAAYPVALPQTDGAFPPHLHEAVASTVPEPTAESAAHLFGSGGKDSGLWESFREGLAYVWSDGPLRAIYGSAIIMNFLLSPLFGLLLPVYVRDVAQSAAGLGAVIAAFSGGAVIGAIIYGARGHRWNRRLTFLVGGVAFSTGIFSMGLMVSVPALIAIMFLMGLIVGPNGPLISTVTHERTPAVMRGRVLSIVNAMCFAGGPLGFLVAGWMIPSAGWQATVLGAGALFGATVTVLTFDRGLKEM